MNKDEQLARLLRLKRFEKPDAAYFDGFLDEFHAYQRKSLASQSAASLWWDRLCLSCSALRRPATVWVAVGAYAAVMLLIQVWPSTDHAEQKVIVHSQLDPATQPIPPASTPAGGVQPWSSAVPANQTIPVSNSPDLVTPPPGKRRTPDQPKDLDQILGPAVSPASNPE